MTTVLVPVDGSPSATRAVDWVARTLRDRRDVRVHLLHVQPAMDAWEVRSHLGADDLARFQSSADAAVLEPAAATLRAAGLAVDTHGAAGDVAPQVQDHVHRLGCDAIVMRHPIEGAAVYAAKVAKPIIINAGDGAHAHPSQGLLDMFTLKEKGLDFKGAKMVILGDILYSRVARSNITAWKKLGADVHVAGPRTLLPYDIASLGVTVHDNVEEAIEGAQVIDVLRIQLERQKSGLFPSPREYARVFGLNKKRLALAAKDCIVMHPGPMNRGLEISWDVGYCDQAAIRDEVQNGVAVRMALIYLTLTGGKPIETLN